MKKVIQGITIVLIISILITGFLVFRAKDALFPDTLTLDQLAAQLTPHYQVFKPETGVGPFPAVLIFHGCAGLRESMTKERVAWLNGQGYVAIVVDSFKGRNIDASNEDSWYRVCNGYQLHGTERSADVFAAVKYAQSLDFVAKDRLALMGYSHGAWTILDALAYSEQQAPPGLAELPGNALQGVKAIVAYYPYCGWPAQHRNGWQSKTPVLMFLAGQDRIVDVDYCIALDKLMTDKKQGALKATFFPEADHVFDTESGLKTFNPTLAKQALNEISELFQRHL